MECYIIIIHTGADQFTSGNDYDTKAEAEEAAKYLTEEGIPAEWLVEVRES